MCFPQGPVNAAPAYLTTYAGALTPRAGSLGCADGALSARLLVPERRFPGVLQSEQRLRREAPAAVHRHAFFRRFRLEQHFCRCARERAAKNTPGVRRRFGEE